MTDAAAPLAAMLAGTAPIGPLIENDADVRLAAATSLVKVTEGCVSTAASALAGSLAATPNATSWIATRIEAARPLNGVAVTVTVESANRTPDVGGVYTAPVLVVKDSDPIEGLRAHVIVPLAGDAPASVSVTGLLPSTTDTEVLDPKVSAGGGSGEASPPPPPQAASEATRSKDDIRGAHRPGEVEILLNLKSIPLTKCFVDWLLRAKVDFPRKDI